MSTVGYQIVIELSYDRGLRRRYIRKTWDDLPTQEVLEEMEAKEDTIRGDRYSGEQDYNGATVVNVFPYQI